MLCQPLFLLEHLEIVSDILCQVKQMESSYLMKLSSWQASGRCSTTDGRRLGRRIIDFVAKADIYEADGVTFLLLTALRRVQAALNTAESREYFNREQ
jgi:hypothetical protein